MSSGSDRETVLGSGIGDAKIVKQRSGMGIYASIRIAVRALPRGQGVVLAWNAGDSFPSKFIPAVMDGIRETTRVGTLAGLEMTDVLVSVEDGSYHEVDSSSDAFREVAKQATKIALQQATPAILEAVSAITIRIPNHFVSAVTETIASSGGKIETVNPELAEATILTSIAAARAEELTMGLLGVCKGQASISIASQGYRLKPIPPEMSGKWASWT